jgi:molybdopterin molybdotransferase
MDGYAVRAADVAAASATLKVIGESAAGHPYDGRVGAGESVRIFTGGVLPAGADTVVLQEITTRHGASGTGNKSAAAGRNVRVSGLDFKAGDVLLQKGRRLSGRDLALAAAMNHPTLPVHRRPKIAVLATGDELVMPGREPGPGEVVYSNGYANIALAAAEGAIVLDLGIAPDRLDATTAAVRRAREARADILVTSGGASVGDHDLVQQALAAEGLALSFWQIALRPGKPMMHGKLGPMRVLGLPGNPVSAFVCGYIFMVPLIRALSGRRDREPLAESARLGIDLPENDHRAEYMRASLTVQPDGTLVATPFPKQDSSMLTPLANADCLLFRDVFAPAARAGDPCSILKLPL